jgi:hypothetical protein
MEEEEVTMSSVWTRGKCKEESGRGGTGRVRV